MHSHDVSTVVVLLLIKRSYETAVFMLNDVSITGPCSGYQASDS